MKDDLLYFIHIYECILRVKKYTKEGKAAFMASTLIQDAVARNLQTMAESTQRLPEDFKKKHPHIEWKQIAGFRNVLVHGYLGIDLDQVWEVVKKDLPPLRKVLPPLPRKKQLPASPKTKKKKPSSK